VRTLTHSLTLPHTHLQSKFGRVDSIINCAGVERERGREGGREGGRGGEGAGGSRGSGIYILSMFISIFEDSTQTKNNKVGREDNEQPRLL
jgi:hypothetical protein